MKTKNIFYNTLNLKTVLFSVLYFYDLFRFKWNWFVNFLEITSKNGIFFLYTVIDRNWLIVCKIIINLWILMYKIYHTKEKEGNIEAIFFCYIKKKLFNSN